MNTNEGTRKQDLKSMLEEFDGNQWQNLDFKDQEEQFSLGEHEISPLHSLRMYGEQQKQDEPSIGLGSTLQQYQFQQIPPQQQYFLPPPQYADQTQIMRPQIVRAEQQPYMYPPMPQDFTQMGGKIGGGKGFFIPGQLPQQLPQISQMLLGGFQHQPQPQAQGFMPTGGKIGGKIGIGKQYIPLESPASTNPIPVALPTQPVLSQGRPEQQPQNPNPRHKEVKQQDEHVNVNADNDNEDSKSENSGQESSSSDSTFTHKYSKQNSLIMGGKTAKPQVQQDEDPKKKRGRRKLEDDQYYSISNDKIKEWEYLLQNSKTLSKKEKKVLRNRISAQKSRNKKKEEFGVLTTQIECQV